MKKFCRFCVGLVLASLTSLGLFYNSVSAYEPPIGGFIMSNPLVSGMDFYSGNSDVSLRKIRDGVFKILPASNDETTHLYDLKLVYARPVGDDVIGNIFHIQYIIYSPLQANEGNPMQSFAPQCPSTIQGYNIFDCSIENLSNDYTRQAHLWPAAGADLEDPYLYGRGGTVYYVDLWGVYTSMMTYNYWTSQGQFLNFTSGTGDLYFYFNNIEIYPLDATNRDIIDAIENSGDAGAVIEQNREEDRQDMENAQSDAQDSGDSSADSASSDGQTLLQAFSSFVSTLLSASPSNCNINMDTGFIDFGSVNLCSLTPPPAFQAISSIVVIGFAVPLSLACAKKMIELFRGFQN